MSWMDDIKKKVRQDNLDDVVKDYASDNPLKTDFKATTGAQGYHLEKFKDNRTADDDAVPESIYETVHLGDGRRKPKNDEEKKAQIEALKEISGKLGFGGMEDDVIEVGKNYGELRNKGMKRSLTAEELEQQLKKNHSKKGKG